MPWHRDPIASVHCWYEQNIGHSRMVDQGSVWGAGVREILFIPGADGHEAGAEFSADHFAGERRFWAGGGAGDREPGRRGGAGQGAYGFECGAGDLPEQTGGGERRGALYGGPGAAAELVAVGRHAAGVGGAGADAGARKAGRAGGDGSERAGGAARDLRQRGGR